MMLMPMLLSRPAPTCLHDPVGGAGDDEVARLRHEAAEFGGLRVRRMIGLEPGRAEDGDFTFVAKGGQHLEGIAQLAQGGAQQLDVAAGRPVPHQLVGGLLDLLHQLLDADLIDLVVGLNIVIVNGFKGSAAAAPGLRMHRESPSS
jgi:hypothetical protein